MTERPFDPGAFVDAAAPLFGFVLTPESRAEAMLHLAIAAEQARLLLAGAIGDEAEPAPVYRP